MNKKPYINYIAKRYFSSRKKVRMISATSVITILGTFLGTFAIIAALSVMNGFREMIFQRTQDMAPALTFYVKNADESERRMVYDEIAEDDDIKTFSPVIERKMLINSGKYQQLAFVKGVSPDKYQEDHEC
ncbi:MAG: ABC transporter permease [Candidatus Marinimicrobia bacterium]|nr:ABC transporter permease [Candidatus Neomarinimicrobiota bacterium]